MWTRKELKTRAKAVLTNCYWSAFVVSLVIMFVGGGSSGGNSGGSSRVARERFSSEYFSYFDFVLLFSIIAIVLLIIMVLRILLGYIIEVGGRKYFLHAAENDVNMNYLGFGFKKGIYINIIKAMLYRGVLIFLWTLLLIIPGIIKSYAYRMVPYILANNPEIGYSRAVELSNAMTEGHKFDIFVLDLSFIGWYLLGIIALFIGTWFVMPYENATNAELYLVLRNDALRQGICSYEELKLNPEII